MTNPTELLAQFIQSVRFEDLPEPAARYAANAITDCVGVALAGSVEPLARHLVAVLTDGRGEGPAYLFGTDRRAGWAEAALYNGAAAHAIDYDDTSHPAYTHPSSQLVPVLFSLGRYTRASGRTLITAYAVGLEVEGKLGRAMNYGHYAKGWHPTGTFGALGACGTASKLLGLNTTQIRNAMGVAASGASGIRANFGTMTKPLHPGLAAYHGVLAGLLAAKGFTAAGNILEHPLGFMQVFAGEDRPRAEAFSELGPPLRDRHPLWNRTQAFPFLWRDAYGDRGSPGDSPGDKGGRNQRSSGRH